MISNSFEFGQTIRERRKELGYTQVFLTEFSGFSVSFISDLEKGKETAEINSDVNYYSKFFENTGTLNSNFF